MITERLQVYGPSLCPICGNRRETVFMDSKAGRLTCRKHPGHPLFEPPERAGGLPEPARVGIGEQS